MAIDGRINVDVLFHDTDGTTSLKVVSLEESTAYTTGKVAVLTGTAGTAATTIFTGGPTTYRDAAGQLVELNIVLRAAFTWSNANARYLESTVQSDPDVFETFALSSNNNQVAVGTFRYNPESLVLAATPNNTGTYTVILYGT